MRVPPQGRLQRAGVALGFACLVLAVVPGARPAMAQASGPAAPPGGAVPGRQVAGLPGPRAAAAAARDGAVVVGLGQAARPAAKDLARAVYGDALLRPGLDEASARVLVGEPVAPGAAARASELRVVWEALAAGPEPSVAVRLLSSIGSELGDELVVAVDASGPSASARVLRVASGRFLSVRLGAEAPGPAAGQAGATAARWPDAVAVLRGLLAAASAGGRAAVPAAAPGRRGGNGSDLDLLGSPWFWGGLGTLAAIGVAVFVAAQVSRDDTDTVRLQGRVSP
ncbi:MAG: hypothetical protein HY744_15060 [Deltaproteobacteria bacterium]|nr:hypothetical protein [Deltaproteobacteria bacterium]